MIPIVSQNVSFLLALPLQLFPPCFNILVFCSYLEFSNWISTHMKDIWTLRPGFYTEFQAGSIWQSDLAWGAILEKPVYLVFISNNKMSNVWKQIQEWFRPQMLPEVYLSMGEPQNSTFYEYSYYKIDIKTNVPSNACMRRPVQAWVSTASPEGACSLWCAHINSGDATVTSANPRSWRVCFTLLKWPLIGLGIDRAWNIHPRNNTNIWIFVSKYGYIVPSPINSKPR